MCVYVCNFIKYECELNNIFSITPVFSVTWSFRNNSHLLIWCKVTFSNHLNCLIFYIYTQIYCILFSFSFLYILTPVETQNRIAFTVVPLFPIAFFESKKSTFHKAILAYQHSITSQGNVLWFTQASSRKQASMRLSSRCSGYKYLTSWLRCARE